ncbi:MAG: cytochrome c [Vicinamibacterales bacterium]|nr:cytochrome c [Vicinamibacterales bacterium]
MRYRATALAVLGLAAVVARPAPALAQAHVERGMKIFADSKCSLCHSVAGKGNAKGALDDVGQLPAAEIRGWLTDPEAMRKKGGSERKPVMKSFATLPKDDLDALVAYLQTLKKK